MKNLTLASIESFTGGLFAATIVEKPGASKYFKGTIVTYHNDIDINKLSDLLINKLLTNRQMKQTTF